MPTMLPTDHGYDGYRMAMALRRAAVKQQAWADDKYFMAYHDQRRNMQELKIEKGIPLPLDSRRKSGFAATFSKMEIGDSVFIEGRTHAGISGSLTYQRLHGRIMRARVVEGGVRVWRIA